MGKLTDSLLSGSSGTVGRVVVANVSGNEILRKRPSKRLKAPSVKQLLIQARMIQCYDFILPYKEYAKKHFGMRINMKSPYNQAMTNLLTAFKLDFVLNTINTVYAEIEFSKGPLLSLIPTGLTSPAPLTLTLTWFQNSNGDALRETDALQVLYFAEGEKMPIFIENLATRIDATTNVPVPPNLAGKTVHVWAAFRSADLSSVSLSAYAGTIVIS